MYPICSRFIMLFNYEGMEMQHGVTWYYAAKKQYLGEVKIWGKTNVIFGLNYLRIFLQASELKS